MNNKGIEASSMTLEFAFLFPLDINQLDRYYFAGERRNGKAANNLKHRYFEDISTSSSFTVAK